MNDDQLDALLSRSLHEASLRRGRQAPAATPAWARRERPRHFGWLWKAGAAGLVLDKLLVGSLVAAAIVGTSVGVKTVVTGSPDPLVWGHTVTQSVTSCKADRTSTDHAIGSCVSSTADHKGQDEAQSHVPARTQHGQPVQTQGVQASEHGSPAVLQVHPSASSHPGRDSQDASRGEAVSSGHSPRNGS